MNKRHIISASLASFLAAAVHTPATAQSIDYGSFEIMFGEPVTTSATGKPQRASDITLSMTILTAEDIRRTGATTIPEALKNVPELAVWQTSRNHFEVNPRGYNQVMSSHLLVLVNGRQVYLDNYGYTIWDTIPVQLDEIRQIEIVKGPNTALFGFNATSGVINIITYNPLIDDVSVAKYTHGTGNFNQADVVHSFKINDKIGARVSGSHKTANEFKHGADLTDSTYAFLKPKRNTASIDTVVQLSDHAQLRTEASLSNVDENELLNSYSIYPAPYSTKSIRSEYQLDSNLGLIKANVYKNWAEIGNFTGVNIHMKNDVTVAQLEDTIKIGSNHTVRGTLEHRVNTLTATNVGAGAKIWYDVNSASGMWDWQITDTISMNNAVRVDNFAMHRSGPFAAFNPYTYEDYDSVDTYPSYNSGVAWKVTPRDTLRASTAHGVELPNLSNLSTNLYLPPYSIIGNPDLKPVYLTHYEAAWDHQFDAPKLKTTLTYFHQNIENLSLAELTTINVGDSSSNGITAALDGAWGEHFTWDASYTYQIVNDDIFDPRRNFKDATPKHTIRAHAGYAINDWELDGYAMYVSAIENYDSTSFVSYALVPFDDYITTSARIGYNINDATTIALAGQHLESAHSAQNAGLDVERSVFLSLTRKF